MDYTYSRFRGWGGHDHEYAEYVHKKAKEYAHNALVTIQELHYKVVKSEAMLYPILEQHKLSSSDCKYGLKIEEQVGYESTEKLETKLHTAISSEVSAKVRGWNH